jgi:hypothetical protein
VLGTLAAGLPRFWAVRLKAKSQTRDETTTDSTTRQLNRITVKGDVALENWAEIFRCFVSPTARMGLKGQRLGIDFELYTPDGKPFDMSDPAVKALEESARQLGLDFRAT